MSNQPGKYLMGLKASLTDQLGTKRMVKLMLPLVWTKALLSMFLSAPCPTLIRQNCSPIRKMMEVAMVTSPMKMEEQVRNKSKRQENG